MTDRDIDEPVPDVMEQLREAVPADGESEEIELPLQIPLEADPADVAEQARTVQLGEDDYR
jgi:hypothetical protein